MTVAEPATARLDQEATEVGSVFVSNYPPYSVWSESQVPAALEALDQPPQPGAELGLYLHIPFCRKRCKFCYFRVFTDKNSTQIVDYLDAVAREVEAYGRRPAIDGRRLRFVYFGGGTPSYISATQLSGLVDRIKAVLPWDQAEEVAFECEPGTLTQTKLEVIREIGVTRLSLGLENFDDEILELNGRAHVSTEIERVRPWIRELDFHQVNVDLIAGMVGETWEKWRRTVQKTIDYEPDSVTIYQMELPFNTVFSKDVLRGEAGFELADWKRKREWHQYAFEELEKAGYRRWSAYTMLKDRGREQKFVYTDALWSGSDMIGVGVSSFSHLSGVHFQNHDRWEPYLGAMESGGPAIARAHPTTAEERLRREVILQLKRGRLSRDYFRRRYGEDVRQRFAGAFDDFASQGLLTIDEDEIRLSEAGVYRVDQLLPAFYEEKYREVRYT